jgi:hypothetical protein
MDYFLTSNVRIEMGETIVITHLDQRIFDEFPSRLGVQIQYAH